MEIWLDTINQELINDASQRGLLHGITTNPTIVSKSQKSLEEILENMLDVQDGPVAIQVVAKSSEDMVREAEIFTAHSPRVIVKVPVCNEGLFAIYTLTQKRIPVMATAVFEPYQALLALKAGAHYIAPYVGKIEDRGLDAREILTTIQTFIKNYSFESKIIAAGIRSQEFVLFCAEKGIAAVTIGDQVYRELITDHPGTTEALEKFDRDMKENKQPEKTSKTFQNFMFDPARKSRVLNFFGSF